MVCASYSVRLRETLLTMVLGPGWSRTISCKAVQAAACQRLPRVSGLHLQQVPTLMLFCTAPRGIVNHYFDVSISFSSSTRHMLTKCDHRKSSTRSRNTAARLRRCSAHTAQPTPIHSVTSPRMPSRHPFQLYYAYRLGAPFISLHHTR